jgi:hypothetical protein
MFSKKCLKPRHSVFKKHSRKNKYLTYIVMELISRNEHMKHEMNVAIDPHYVDDNILVNLLVSVITFGCLNCMKVLHKTLMSSELIKSRFELNNMIYSAIILQLIYVSIYLTKKKNGFYE